MRYERASVGGSPGHGGLRRISAGTRSRTLRTAQNPGPPTAHSPNLRAESASERDGGLSSAAACPVPGCASRYARVRSASSRPSVQERTEPLFWPPWPHPRNTAHPAGASCNDARKIDSILANGLETIPGGSGIMAILAARNLRRGLALGLASGEGAANALGLTPLTAAHTQRTRSSTDVRRGDRVGIGIQICAACGRLPPSRHEGSSPHRPTVNYRVRRMRWSARTNRSV
jgi:hypothetical protein